MTIALIYNDLCNLNSKDRLLDYNSHVKSTIVHTRGVNKEYEQGNKSSRS